jgi:hypothetical protein
MPASIILPTLISCLKLAMFSTTRPLRGAAFLPRFKGTRHLILFIFEFHWPTAFFCAIFLPSAITFLAVFYFSIAADSALWFTKATVNVSGFGVENWFDCAEAARAESLVVSLISGCGSGKPSKKIQKIN